MKYILIIISFYISTLYSQDKNDSIEKLIDNYGRTVSFLPDSAFYYITKATLESKKVQNDFQLARCLCSLGNYYYLRNNLVKAESYINQSLIYSKRTKNVKSLAFAYNQLGLIAMDRGKYNESLKKLLISLDISSKNKLFNNSCSALINLGSLCELQKDTLKALKYYSQNEKIALDNDFKSILVSTYNNIAILKRNADKKAAVIYYKKAYSLAKMLNDKHEEFAILVNLSDLYLSKGTQKNNYEAYRFLQKAKTIALEMGNEDNLYFVYFNLGGYYLKKDNYPEALKMYNKALELSKKGINEDQNVKLYSSVAKIYRGMDDYERAYFYQEKFHSGQDSIFSVEKSKGFNDIQTKYEVEKKNLKIKLLIKENVIEQNRRRFIVVVGLSLLIISLLFILFFRHKGKTQKLINETENKIFKQEKERLEQEHELKRILGVLEGQDQERNRLAKEIHDGVGGQLAGIKLNLSQVNSDIKNENIKVIVNQLGKLFQELRSISHDLSLNYTKEKSIRVLLQELLMDYQNRKEFAVDLIVFPEEGLLHLPENVKHQLYRIIQELVANISKHAGANNVLISITQHEGFLNLIVEDDGCGFSDKEVKGIGLKNIEERLFSMNGELTIESVRGKGSTIVIDIPN